MNKSSHLNKAAFLLLSLVTLLVAAPASNWAQDGDEPATTASTTTPDVDEVAQQPAPSNRLSLFDLLRRGGWLMAPIYLMSILTLGIGIERGLSLRRGQVLPAQLVQSLGKMTSSSEPFEPRAAYQLCQRHPSAAATVIRTMLVKVGRPHSEVEHAVGEASQREAERLYSNVRWLNLAAAVSPLMGLFGTVWGMIVAFYDTSNLAVGANKADELAQGIYVALVTTLAGLAVAIPAAILSHYYEGKIRTMFHQIDELLFNLLPQIERFEGRERAVPETLQGGKVSKQNNLAAKPVPQTE